MIEVARRRGVSVVRKHADDKLANDPRVYLARHDEWFAVVERPDDPQTQVPRYGIAKILETGDSEVRWYSGSGCPNINALFVYASLENEKSTCWTK